MKVRRERTFYLFPNFLYSLIIISQRGEKKKIFIFSILALFSEQYYHEDYFHQALLLRGHMDKPSQVPAGIFDSYFIWSAYFITAHTVYSNNPICNLVLFDMWQFRSNHLLVLCKLFSVPRLLVLYLQSDTLVILHSILIWKAVRTNFILWVCEDTCWIFIDIVYLSSQPHMAQYWQMWLYNIKDSFTIHLDGGLLDVRVC